MGWISAEGRKIPIHELEDQHLINIYWFYRFFNHRLPHYEVVNRIERKWGKNPRSYPLWKPKFDWEIDRIRQDSRCTPNGHIWMIFDSGRHRIGNIGRATEPKESVIKPKESVIKPKSDKRLLLCRR